uniref:RNA-directed DNA polymerase, eukaryota n=1 Tax=Tanacetum cinerariifolium TaxID=118510 RepID=A0A6L2MIX2_TANCI|nr:RNA-directed DNA polymerase, eukaryota [Tanacetum cinerariifolium]
MERSKGVHAYTQNSVVAQGRRSLKITSQRDTISYFFTNIPSGLNETIRWKAIAKQGRISDVYMAKKTTVNGRRSGFAIFLSVDDRPGPGYG